MKLTIDYDPWDDCCGSVFYFDDWDEMINFITIAHSNSYHNYFIEDWEPKPKEEENA